MTNCEHKWKYFTPEIRHWFDGWHNGVTLIYEDWCKECGLVERRTEDYIETKERVLDL